MSQSAQTSTSASSPGDRAVGPRDVRITRVQALPFRIPYRQTHWQAIGALDALESVLIRIETNQSVTGIGESLATNKFNSNTLAGTTAVIREHLGPVIVGLNPFDLAGIWERMNRACHGEIFAKGGIDIALHDLAGKLLDLPVCLLIGGRCCDEIPIEGPGYGIGIMTPSAMADAARAAVDHGLTQIEIKISGNLAEDVERLQVRQGSHRRGAIIEDRHDGGLLRRGGDPGNPRARGLRCGLDRAAGAPRGS